MKTVIGLFDHASDAYAAQSDLVGSGITQDRVSVVTSPSNREYKSGSSRSVDTLDRDTDRSEAGEGAGIGATAGAIAGGAAGLLASLGLLAIPGIGPLLAAGPIVAILTGAGIGAAAGGLIGGLIGLGIPEHEAEIYAEGVNRGGTLLTVDASDSDADRVAAVLSQHNAVDIDKRASEWEASGWARKYPNPLSSSTSTVDPRSRGVDRGTSATTGYGTSGAAQDVGSTRSGNAARIYNPR